ncbi:NAD-dependent epimerase/dehydratase family protein [Tropicibacter naphthalenivorans]|uniref:dTDP-glucose 4,6-dehydratase n=1 Tax=Tropicibacter naphthalenivorans TaxID=441103 RepID=A0A0P1GJL0_9RHOB|nr:NAD-dependent epimerase/dehydratase family protein [Tropicibacter naphthalenivorans]CUH82326.1 dTDP-glucose 4,6-dehydratase [Tropicibacter naphthalenivorans]SMD05627.1 dTDP-L-rhamnose 4-epimerase [Tropicibacter naphthalenivorans]
MTRVLITGGAGFIGSNLVQALHAKGYDITVLDSLSPQIHGEDPMASPLVQSLDGKARLVHASVMDKDVMAEELAKTDIVVHYAAETGTGQSMYQVHNYCDVNIGGTSLMLDLLGAIEHSVKRMVVASSRSIYGEGRYTDAAGNDVYPGARVEADMLAGKFDPLDPATGQPYTLQATDEGSKIHPSSVYGITKQVQEQLVMTVCPTLGIEPVALRYQNVYGPGQSLSNPYTGILSIFSNLIMQGKSINVFEDGLESRDFVFIDDVVAATMLAIEHENAPGFAYNVGSGVATTVLEVVDALIAAYGRPTESKVSGQFRLGDIRHNYADLSLISGRLGFQPSVDFAEGIRQFAAWAGTQGPRASAYERSLEEMKERGLMKGAAE